MRDLVMTADLPLRRRAALVPCGLALLLAACAAGPPSAPAPMQAAAPANGAETVACPPGVVAQTRCVAGRDGEGAYYLFAVPPGWRAGDGSLVVHAHGGPELGAPKASRPVEDLRRWTIWNRLGYAYAASGYHQGGVAVTAAAEDSERVRRIFIAEFGAPRRTYLHGQSWGASVAAKAAERHAAVPVAAGGSYDGVLLTSGVLGGGTQSYQFRLDLRVVYEAVCANHPRPDEPAYPLWQGLPLDRTLTRAQLAARVDECTGVSRRPEERSAEQARRLATILAVVPIEARSLVSHLDWATWDFQDIAFTRLGGRNAFDNADVRYRGSADDDALNAKVARYRADPAARAAFAADADLTGAIGVPVLTMHAISDPTAFVELESIFAETMQRGGSGERLVQVFTGDGEHSYLADAEYVAAMQSLVAWVERGEKPASALLDQRCRAADPAFDPGRGCRIRVDYHPGPLAARVAPR